MNSPELCYIDFNPQPPHARYHILANMSQYDETHYFIRREMRLRSSRRSRFGESVERAAREPSKLTARIKNSNGRSSRSAVGWNERRVRRITQWKKQMKLNRKTARARKTHSVVHLVQLRQKVHRPADVVLSPLVVASRRDACMRFSTTSEPVFFFFFPSAAVNWTRFHVYQKFSCYIKCDILIQINFNKVYAWSYIHIYIRPFCGKLRATFFQFALHWTWKRGHRWTGIVASQRSEKLNGRQRDTSWIFQVHSDGRLINCSNRANV